MATSSHEEKVYNPIPISFAPPNTEGVMRTANPVPSVPVGETDSAKKGKRSKKSKANEESPSISTELKKTKKPKTDEDSPSVSSEFKRPDWLPEGWNIIERIREGGKTAGSKDKYYIEPGTGKKFRSQVEVRRHLGFDDPPKPNEKNTPKAKASGLSNKQKADKETAVNGEENKKRKLEDGKINGEESAKKPKEV